MNFAPDPLNDLFCQTEDVMVGSVGEVSPAISSCAWVKNLLSAEPSQARVQLALSGGIEQVGPQEYQVVMHPGDTLQLTPNCADPLQNPSGAVGNFQFISRNRLVVTCSDTGLCSAVSLGGVSVTIQNQTTLAQCSLQITVVPV